MIRRTAPEGNHLADALNIDDRPLAAEPIGFDDGAATIPWLPEGPWAGENGGFCRKQPQGSRGIPVGGAHATRDHRIDSDACRGLRSCERRGDRPGLTLVELLVIIAIIGLLVALLLPAMNGARESSRKNVCNNNLRQIAIASVAHLEQQGKFPSSGFGPMSPNQISGDRGFHELQGGSWLYNILPYIDLGNLRNVPSSHVSGTCPPAYRCPTTFSARSTRQGVNSYAGSRGTIDTRFPAKVGTYGGTTHNFAPVRSVDADGQNVHVSVSEGYAPDKRDIFRNSIPDTPTRWATCPIRRGRPAVDYPPIQSPASLRRGAACGRPTSPMA